MRAQVLIQRLNPYATIPMYASEGAAGMDLYAAHSATIEPGEHVLVKTGIAMHIPDGYYGRIAPRSGLAYKHGIDVFAGVIDNDYRGEIGVILYNSGKEPFEVAHGDRIAQMIITPYERTQLVEVGALDETERGQGGFGSTGKN